MGQYQILLVENFLGPRSSYFYEDFECDGHKGAIYTTARGKPVIKNTNGGFRTLQIDALTKIAGELNTIFANIARDATNGIKHRLLV